MHAAPTRVRAHVPPFLLPTFLSGTTRTHHHGQRSKGCPWVLLAHTCSGILSITFPPPPRETPIPPHGVVQAYWDHVVSRGAHVSIWPGLPPHVGLGASASPTTPTLSSGFPLGPHRDLMHPLPPCIHTLYTPTVSMFFLDRFFQLGF